MKILIVLIFLLFVVAIEIYIYFGLKFSLGIEKPMIVKVLYFCSLLIFLAGIFLFLFSFKTSAGSLKLTANIIFGIGFSLFIAKLFLATFFLGEDILRTLKYIFEKISSSNYHQFLPRHRITALTGLVVALLPFSAMAYGVIFGKYDFKIHTKQLVFNELPASFSGFKIVQISDLHLGSIDSKEKIEKAVAQIIELKPDIVLFTGDMVNNLADEAEPYIEIFAQIKPKYGKFSILGNHDYAFYSNLKSEKEKTKNMEKLCEIHHKMGFRLLKNESTTITNGIDSIRIAGVENWGSPPFPQFGDLKNTLANASDSDFIILLSHDPSHWDLEVKNYSKKVHLTLSGHTHGMQIGLEIPDFKWSPVQYKYSKWSDLYEENGKFLYINRGFGFIGYPGRIGIWPEITVIELRNQ